MHGILRCGLWLHTEPDRAGGSEAGACVLRLKARSRGAGVGVQINACGEACVEACTGVHARAGLKGLGREGRGLRGWRVGAQRMGPAASGLGGLRPKGCGIDALHRFMRGYQGGVPGLGSPGRVRWSGIRVHGKRVQQTLRWH